MKNKILVTLLSLSLFVSYLVPVMAAQPENAVESGSVEMRTTDRFIVEQVDTSILPFNLGEKTISTDEIKEAAEDATSDDITSDMVEITELEVDSNVIVLPDEVDADSFIQKMEDKLDGDVTIHPDYPVYMTDALTETEEEPASGEETENDPPSEPDYTDFAANLAAAQQETFQQGARVAILGPYYNYQGSNNSYIVDATNYVSGNNTYNSSSSGTTESNIISMIHNIAPLTNIIPIGVFSETYNSGYSSCHAYTSDIVRGIQYAQNHGAHIVLCNWYTNEYNEYLERKMNEAQMLFVVSAGPVVDIHYSIPGYPSTRESVNTVYPACFNVNNMITVSALYSDYSRKYDVAYDDQIDLYSISQYTNGTTTLDGALSATAYVASCAALVYAHNNSANNLKTKIMNGAFDVNYLPGQQGYESYKALSFYHAVKGEANSETININTAHNTTGNYDSYLTGVDKIYYENIKQIAAGVNGIAVLLDDGTVKVCSLNSSTPASGNYFGLGYGTFETVSGFPTNVTIEKIAMSPDGNALAAIDNSGDLYVLGKKTELGETNSGSGSESYLTPHKETNISHAKAVYFGQDTLFVKEQNVSDNIVVLKSRGSNPYRTGDNYQFNVVEEAAEFTDIDFYSNKMAFVKNGTAYLSNSSSSGNSYFTALTMNTNSPVTDVELTYNKIYMRTEDKTLYYADISGSTVSSVYSIEGNVGKLVGTPNMVLYTKDSTGNQYDNYFYLTSSIYNSYESSIPKTATITSAGEFGGTSSTYSYGLEVPFGTYLLTNDQTLYRGDLYNSSSGTGQYPTEFNIVAQKTFAPQTIDSIVPVNIEEQYGSEALTSNPSQIINAKTNGKATITLTDGTDVVVPVTWPTTGLTVTDLGTQSFTGTLSLPQGITQPENVNAVANICIKAPITDVSNTQLEVEHDATKAGIIAQLPSTVTVTLPSNPSTATLPVTWDTSTFEPQPGNTYTIYGHIQTNDQISNPYNKVSVATITVGPITVEDIPINSITPISINANEGLSLQIGTKPYVGENPQTLVEVPATVTGNTADGSITLNVTWDDSNYNPFNVGIAQRITGTVEVPNGYALGTGVEPVLYVTALPRTYEVISVVPETIETSVLGGSSISAVNDSISNHKVGVEAIDSSSDDIVYFFADFEVTANNNANYDPDYIGTQNVNGSFICSNITMFNDSYIPVEVDVVSSEIDIVSTAEVNAYQSVSLEDNENIPDTVNITLVNGASVTADVEWDFANYQKDIAGDQIITGRLVNLPSGVIQSTPERIATLIVHVTPVNYKITYVDTPMETVNALIDIEDLAENLSSNTVSVELESITNGITLTTTYDMPFTISAEDNPDYDPEMPDLYIINGEFTLPNNISNPDDELCQIFLTVEALDIVIIDPARVTVTEGTPFTNIGAPTQVDVTLSNGTHKMIDVDWGTGTGYNPNPDFGDDESVEEIIYGTLINVPAYINYYGEPVYFIITVMKLRTYYISGITPGRIPATGALTLNLGSTLNDIYNAIDSHTATISLVDGNNNAVEGITVNFTIEAADNASYSPTTLGQQTVIAHLALPNNIQNPNNIQLPIVVNLVKRTVRSATVVRLNNIPYGTSFNDLGLPAEAPVQYTDNTSGALPATWNSSTYNPNRIGAQVIRGTFNTPLPIYAENPNNRQPVAAVTIVQANTNIISAEPMENIQTRNVMSRKLMAPKYSRMSESIDTEEIPGLRIRNYNVTMQHADGSITTEIIPVFETVE